MEPRSNGQRKRIRATYKNGRSSSDFLPTCSREVREAPLLWEGTSLDWHQWRFQESYTRTRLALVKRVSSTRHSALLTETLQTQFSLGAPRISAFSGFSYTPSLLSGSCDFRLKSSLGS